MKNKSASGAVRNFTAFDCGDSIASADLAQVATLAKQHIDGHPESTILIFDDLTGEQIDLDLRGPLKKVLQHLPDFDPNKPDDSSLEVSTSQAGRPKLGVESKEVTLLPRHWTWLKQQRGGASVTIRKLVEEARRASMSQDQSRRSREATYRFIAASAGNLPYFDEVARALFSGNLKEFSKNISDWPEGIRDYATKLSGSALSLSKD